MKIVKWFGGGLLILAVLVLGFAAFGLPSLVKTQASAWVKENTGRELVIERLAVNPLRLSVEADGVRLSEAQSEEVFVSLEHLRVNLSAKSLLQRALILSEVLLDGPSVQVVRLREKVFNFSDLLPPPGPEEDQTAKEAGEPFRFSVNNLQVTGGAVTYLDRTLSPEKRHTVRRLSLAVPFFGNVPYLAERYITPAFSAMINDSPVAFGGRMKPFAQKVEVAVNVDLQDLNLPFYLAHLPVELPVKLKSGRLATDFEVVYRVTETERPELEIEGTATFTGLSALDRTGQKLVFLPFIQIPVKPSRVLERELHMGEVAVYDLEVYVARDDAGSWNFARLTVPEQDAAAVADKGEAPPPFLATMKGLRLREGRLFFADAQPSGGFATKARELTLDVGPLATAGGEKTPFALSLETERGESAKATGDFSLQPVSLTASTEIRGVPLAAYYPYMEALLSAPVAGTAEVRANLAFDGESGLRVSAGQLEARNVSVPFGPDEGFALARLAVDGAAIAAADNRVAVETVSLEGGDLRFSRSPEGELSPLSLLREERKGEKPAVQETGGGQPWDYRVGRIAGGGWQIAFRDELPGGKPAFNLSGLEFALENLAGPRPAESPFRLAATYGRRGGVELSGQAVLAEPKVKGTIRLKGLPLPDFAPYLPEKVRAELAGGLLYATLELDVLAGGKELQATFGGDLMVRDFLLLDGRRRADLLRFGTLQIDGVRGTAAPFSLEVATVALSDYAAKVAIDEEGRVNLQDIVAAGEEPAQETPPGEEAAAGPPPEISIGAITLQGGTVDFSDRQVRPSFATTMVNLGGRVSGLSSAPGTLAEVDLRGNLENQAPLSITGRIHPLGEPFFLDLKVSFHGIELTPTTPYSGTFLGYTIDKGKLDLDLAYRVEEKNLEARNKVFLDQFTLGGRVKSEKATGLPVKLAVALLKDRRGEIRLDLPVTGRTDDPKFSIFSVVLKILKNLLVKAATSPLALLQVAFGGGDSDFSSVVFPPGSSNLTPPEEEKLRRLATAFQDRPALRLEVKGFFDPERDPEGYRRNLLEQKMRQEKFLHLVKEKQNLPGQTAADLEIAPEERSGYLEAVYKKADFPKPRGFFGIAKKLPDAEMEKLILASTPVGPDEMAQVARSRAVRVMNFLVAEGGLPKERLFLTRPPDAAAPPKTKGADRSRVELGVSAK